MPNSFKPTSGGNMDSHSGECNEELSARYTEYIEEHLEALRIKCKQILVCIKKLVEDEDFLFVLHGENLKLKKTCSLVYKMGNEVYGNFSGQCTTDVRNVIQSDLEKNLKDRFQENKPAWKNVKKCLNNTYGNVKRITFVDKICGLAQNNTQICNFEPHQTVETFFNNKIQHLKCTCKALQIEEASSVSLPILITAGIGSVLLVLALFAIGFFCYRRHKSKKRKQETPNVIYVQAPTADNCPVYQEIFDDRAYHGYKQSPSLNPPNLPMRFTSSSSKLSQMTGQEDDSGYLEPAAAITRSRPQLPIPGNSNPNYGAPPDYRENDPADKEDSYFDPIPSPDEDGEKGYDTLDRMKAHLDKSAPIYKITETDPSDMPKSKGEPSNPIPAKRTKMNDQQAESTYFVLEKDRGSRTENVSV